MALPSTGLTRSPAMIVTAVAIGTTVFGEVLTLRLVIGIAVILVAVTLIVVLPKERANG